jgi:hypothetical protein
MDRVVLEFGDCDESGPLLALFLNSDGPPIKLSTPSAGRAPRSRSILIVVGSFMASECKKVVGRSRIGGWR